MTRLATTLLALVLIAPSARGQEVRLQIRDETTRDPVPGAIVRLLGEQGTAAQALTNELGVAVLRAAAGVYRVKVDRIGWAGFISEPLLLGAGDNIRNELLISSVRVELAPLVVQAKRGPCERSGQEGALAAALWEETRKALTANLLTQSEDSIPLLRLGPQEGQGSNKR